MTIFSNDNDNHHNNNTDNKRKRSPSLLSLDPLPIQYGAVRVVDQVRLEDNNDSLQLDEMRAFLSSLFQQDQVAGSSSNDDDECNTAPQDFFSTNFGAAFHPATEGIDEQSQRESFVGSEGLCDLINQTSAGSDIANIINSSSRSSSINHGAPCDISIDSDFDLFQRHQPLLDATSAPPSKIRRVISDPSIAATVALKNNARKRHSNPGSCCSSSTMSLPFVLNIPPKPSAVPSPSNPNQFPATVAEASVSHHQLSSMRRHRQQRNRKQQSAPKAGRAPLKFRKYQADQWEARYQELVAYQATYGHCLVDQAVDRRLSHWVKRQRCQMKLKQDGNHTTLTDERQGKLEALGFVWDSHEVAWEYRYNDLLAYMHKHGNVNVPTVCEENPSLGIWVKGQRRQYRLHRSGQRSTLSPKRIHKLNEVGFRWVSPCMAGRSPDDSSVESQMQQPEQMPLLSNAFEQSRDELSFLLQC